MTQAQMALLDELIENGFITRKVDVLGGTLQAVLTSSTTADQLAVEGALKLTDSVPVHMIHNYQLKAISRVLKSVTYKDKVTIFKSPEEAEEYLITRPAFVVDALMDARTKLENEVNEAAKPEALDANFSKPLATDSDSK